MFIFFLIFFSLLSVSSMCFYTFWVGIELSVFFFLSTLSEKSGGCNGICFVSIWKYFLSQVVSSLVIIYIFVSLEGEGGGEIETIILILAISLNIGLFPFHGWTYHMVESLSWWKLFILSSVINLPPLFLLSSLNEESLFFMEIFWLSNGVFMAFFLLRPLTLKWFILTSSNYLISWIIFSSFLGWKELISFLAAYWSQSGSVFLIFSFISNSGSEPSLLSGSGNLTSILLLGLMGMPPFSIFFANMVVVSSFLLNGSNVLSLVLLLSSVVSCLAYLKVSSFSSLNKEGYSFFFLSEGNWGSVMVFSSLISSLLFFL